MSSDKEEIGIIETTLGTIQFSFNEDKAPGHVKNFIINLNKLASPYI